MKKLTPTALLGAFITLLVLAWGANLRYGAGLPAGAAPLWVFRAELLKLSGLLAVGLMSLIMVLATARSGWKSPWAAWTGSIKPISGPASSPASPC